jgi:DNA phosphorothioation-dependent restriction protein DptG
MKMCQAPEDVKYAALAADWFQEKGFDFTEELNSMFVTKCVEANQTNLAVTRFLYRKGRIGSWSTPSSLYRLLSALQVQEDHDSIIQLVQTLTVKGVRPDRRSFEIVFHSCVQKGSKEFYEQTMEKAKGLLSPEDCQDLLEKYPIPVSASAEAASAE